MADLIETPSYEPGIYQLETVDPVLGGPGGVSNRQAQLLANRTAYLKQHVDILETAAATFATMADLQAALDALDYKASVRLATTGNISLNGVQTIDGIGGTVGDRVLVKNQTAGQDNGIYVMSATGWARAADASISGEVTSMLTVAVAEGTTNAATRWKLTTPDPIALGTTVLTFADVTAGYAPILSPAFAGNPTAPTPPSGDADYSLATTAFAENLKNGIATIDVTGGANVTVTAAQGGCGLLILTGGITANLELRMPVKNGQWVVANRSTGSFNVTVKYPTGTGVVVPQGQALIVYGDTTNINSASSAGSQLAFSTQPYTPTAGTTSLTVVGGYTPGCLQIEKNGAWLHPAEFTATDGSTVTLGTATTAGDVLTVYAFKSFTVANAVQKGGDTMGGPLLLAANSTAPTPPQFDASTAIANMAAVQRALGSYSSTYNIATTPATLTAADAGKIITFTGSASVVNLPLASTVPIGTSIAFFTSPALTLNRQGSDIIIPYPAATTVSSVAVPGNSIIKATAISSSQWALDMGGGAGFSLAANGYQKFSSGLIMQWGLIAVTAGSAASVTFPIAFPSGSAGYHPIATADQVAATATLYATCNRVSGSQMNVSLNTGSSNVHWIAIGY